MGNKDRIDEIVEKLELSEVKKLAAQRLKGIVGELQDSISRVAEIKRRGDANLESIMRVAISNYESTRAQMQKYGLWKDRYEQVFLGAKENGHVDAYLFFGTENSKR